MVKALYDYRPARNDNESSDDLAMRKDDILEVLEEYVTLAIFLFFAVFEAAADLTKDVELQLVFEM